MLPIIHPTNQVVLLDAGWVLYLIILGAWFVYSIVNDNKKKKLLEDLQEEIKNIPQLSVRVTKTKMPEELKVGPLPCFWVELKGWVSHPRDEKIKLNLFIKDVYNNEEGEEKVMPLICPAIQQWTEGTSRFLRISHTINTSPDGHYQNWTHFGHVPIEYLSPPYKGKRKLRFTMVATDTDAESHWGSYDESQQEKIIHIGSTEINHTFKEVGFLENILNREKIENLSIQIALAIAATDGHLDQKELNEIKSWANLCTTNLEEDAAKEKKKRLSKFIKQAYEEAKAKKLAISSLIDDLNDKAIKEQKYELIDLLLRVVSADDNLSREEDAMLNKIVKKLDIDKKTYDEMKNKTLATVKTIQAATSGDKNSDEGLLGLTDEMTDKEKCKELRKLYSKWNGQTNSTNKKIKSRAKEMIKLIAELRSKYNC